MHQHNLRYNSGVLEVLEEQVVVMELMEVPLL